VPDRWQTEHVPQDVNPETQPLSAEIIDGRPFPPDAPDGGTGAGDDTAGMVPTESVTEPAKVMRIGSMVRQLLEEVRSTQLDEPSRERLAEIYERSIVEISHALSPDLAQELHMLALPFKDGEVPSDGELRIAKAQLVGWLEGLFHGIQATLFAQQLAARQQIEQMRQIPGQPSVGPGQSGGTYL
jgi:hypothetical protein